MSKSKKKTITSVKKSKFVASTPTVVREAGIFDFIPSFRQRLGVLMLISFVLFANSIMNESALDDEIVLNKNQYVQDGTDGIGAILSHDAYSSFYESMQAGDQLSGGRYRPLSIVTFAIEESLFGFSEGDEITFTQGGTEFSGTINHNVFDEKEVLVRDAVGGSTIKRVKVNEIDGFESVYHGRHFVNVLLYLFLIAVLFYLLHHYMIPELKDVAFLAVLIFAVHPIHTEVVANVKSRDEIMSLLFIGLTFLYTFKWFDTKKKKTLLVACLCYFLALLSKEWGIVLVALVPMALVVFKKEKWLSALKATVPILSVAVIYFMIRMSVVGFGSDMKQDDVMNDPYLFATGIEKFATETVVLLNYLKLQLFSYPLSADYSFKTIEYRNLGSWDFWAAIIVHLGLIALMFYYFIKKHFLAFALAFYLGPLFLVSNYVFDIGATMGERLVFHSSFGLCLALAYLGLKALSKLGSIPRQKMLALPVLVIVLGLASFQTISRNSHWKNDASLFIHDVKVVPNSVLANGNAGRAYLVEAEQILDNPGKRDSLLNKAELHLNRALKFHPKFYMAYLNLGYVWFLRNDLEKAEAKWQLAEKIFSRKKHPNFWLKYDGALAFAYFNRGLADAQLKEYEKSRVNFEKAVFYEPNNVQYLEDLGGVSYTLNDSKTALEAWTKALSIDPNKTSCRAGYRALTGKEWGQ